jgi:hypothetical protein
MEWRDRNGMWLEAPPSWTDQTIVAFSGPAFSSGRGRPNLVVTHERLPDEMSLATYAARRILTLGTSLPGFEVRASESSSVAGHLAIRHDVRWIGEGGWLDQSLTWVVRDIDGVPTVVTFTTTLPTDVLPHERTEAQRAFSSILGSVVFDAGRPSRIPPTSVITRLAPLAESDGLRSLVPMPGSRRQ